MQALWTDEEIERLQHSYHSLGGSGCVDLFPNKTITQIYTKAKCLKLVVDPEVRCRNTSSENARRHAAKRAIVDDAIRIDYFEHGPALIAELHGVDIGYVVKRAAKIGIKCNPSMVAEKRKGRRRKVKTTRDWMEGSLSETERLALYGRRVESLVGSGEL